MDSTPLAQPLKEDTIRDLSVADPPLLAHAWARQCLPCKLLCHSSLTHSLWANSSRPYTRVSLIHTPGQRCRACSSSHQQTSEPQPIYSRSNTHLQWDINKTSYCNWNYASPLVQQQAIGIMQICWSSIKLECSSGGLRKSPEWAPPDPRPSKGIRIGMLTMFASTGAVPLTQQGHPHRYADNACVNWSCTPDPARASA
eukprot:1147844-Pelagomonas_calceolata.AAC.7